MPLIVTRSESLVFARGDGMLETVDVAQLTNAIDERVAEEKAFLVVADALGVQGISAPARRFVGEHRNAKLRAAGHLDLGLVLALRSPVVRGAMTAISWFSGSFADLRTVETRLELGALTREIHREKGLALSKNEETALDAFVCG